MRRLILAITGLLLALVVALLLALRSESFVLGTARWSIGAFTKLHLELRNPRVDFYRGELSADEIHLLPVAGQGPALLSVLDFSARLSMPTVFGANPAASFLRASAVMIYLSDSDEASEPAPMQWLGYLRWLPSELSIGQVHLIGAATETWIFPLKRLHGQQLDSRSYRLAADADYEGEPLSVTVDILAVDKGWGVTAAKTRIKLSAPESGSEITLAGTLEGTWDDFSYNFALDAFYRDIREFLKGFEQRDRLAGELRMQGTLAGDTRGFVLSNATFLLNNFPDYGFQASGSLEYALSGKSSIALEANGELASLAYLVDWIDLDVSDFGRAQSNIRLSGSLDKPVVDAFRLTTSSTAGLTVTMSGQLNLFEVDADSGPGANAIAVDMQGPSLAVLEHWLGKLPYDPGPWRASGQLTGNQNTVSLQDIVLEMGTAGSIEIRATGALGRIGLPRGTEEEITVDDIGLSLRAHVPDSAGLATLLGRDDIPPYHELEASLSVNGSAQELQLTDGYMTITASDLVARIGPLGAVLHPAEGATLSGLAGPVVINLSDTAALSQYTTLPMPVLGPLNITARVAQKGEVYQLLDVIGTVKEGNLTIESRGRIGNLATFSDVSLSSKFGGLDTRTVLTTLLPDFSYAAALGTLGGSFKLVEKQHGWTLSQLELTSGDETTPLAFSLDGEVRDLTGLVTADLDSQFRVGDTALLESLSGMALRPVSGSLVLATTAEQIHGSLKAQVGDTRIRGDARVAIAGKQIQSVHVGLDTPQLFLQDFGFAPAQEGAAQEGAAQEGAAREGAPEESPARQEASSQGVAKAGAPEDTSAAQGSAGRLLAQLREKSPSFPVDLTLKIDGITGESSNIDRLQIKVSGIDRRFTLEQFSANYNQALAEVRGIIDLNPTPPALSLAGQANALPLSAILRDVGIASNVSGALTILGGVTVMGDTTAALIANLNGSVAVALENAVIDGAAYDLLATDLLAWIYSGALTEKSTHLDCTMAKFQLRQGVATTESLYIESAKMVATGNAKFDLVKRRMDLRITPLSKSRLLQVPSEVRLKGDMSSPKAEISTISAVADATSSALMLIPSLTLKLFGVNPSSSKSYRPCQADLGN